MHHMIVIGIADGNLTYCQGLKTMLEQVEDFRVVIIPAGSLTLQFSNDLSPDILLADEDLLESCIERAGGKNQLHPPPGIIVLTMDRTGLDSRQNGQEALYKGSGKKEFEERIRKLATGKQSGLPVRCVENN